MLKYDVDKAKSDYTHITVLNADKYVMVGLRGKLEDAGITAYSGWRMAVRYPNFNCADAATVIYVDKTKLEAAVTLLNGLGFKTDEDK